MEIVWSSSVCTATDLMEAGLVALVASAEVLPGKPAIVAYTISLASGNDMSQTTVFILAKQTVLE